MPMPTLGSVMLGPITATTAKPPFAPMLPRSSWHHVDAGGYDEKPWYQEAGPTVSAPFAQDTGYFGRAEQQWMINLRVRDLDAIREQLRAANINVSLDPQQYPNGRSPGCMA